MSERRHQHIELGGGYDEPPQVVAGSALEAEEQQRQADSLITESDHGVNGQKSVGDVTDGFLMRRSRFMLLVILICMMLAATIAASGFLLAVLMLLGLVGSAILLFESRVPHPTVDDNSMV